VGNILSWVVYISQLEILVAFQLLPAALIRKREDLTVGMLTALVSRIFQGWHLCFFYIGPSLMPLASGYLRFLFCLVTLVFQVCSVCQAVLVSFVFNLFRIFRVFLSFSFFFLLFLFGPQEAASHEGHPKLEVRFSYHLLK